MVKPQLLLQVDTAISTMGAAIAPPPASGVSAALSTPKWNARPLVPQVHALLAWLAQYGSLPDGAAYLLLQL